MKAAKTIEFPSRGQTYNRQEFGVYECDEYPAYSVLAGQTRRKFINSYKTLAEAQAEHPDAEVLPEGASTYETPYLNHLSDDGDPDPVLDSIDPSWGDW